MTKEMQNTGVDLGQWCERTEAGGMYLFQCKNAEGAPVLFSQPYKSPDKRDQGMETLRKYAADAGHYAEIETDGHFVFAVKAGNHKEIARSHPYKTAAECRKAMKAFQAHWKGLAEAVPVQQPAMPADLPTGDAAAQSRYRFNVSFYLDKAENRILGKIEYPLVKDDKESFEGLDLERMGRFIRQRLPQPKAQPAPAPPPAPAEKRRLPRTSTLDIIDNGRKVTGSYLHKGQALEVQLHLSPEELRRIEGKAYKASLRIKAMETNARTLLMEEEGVLQAGGAISITAPAPNLGEGLYRFTLHATVKDLENKEEMAEWEGSSLLALN